MRFLCGARANCRAAREAAWLARDVCYDWNSLSHQCCLAGVTLFTELQWSASAESFGIVRYKIFRSGLFTVYIVLLIICDSFDLTPVENLRAFFVVPDSFKKTKTFPPC